MRPEIKFCGLTRYEDAERAVALGAAYIGAIFAGGPRQLTMARARDVMSAAGASVKRVGVFATADVAPISHAVRELGLSVVQLHGDPSLDDVKTVLRETQCEVWPVLRVDGDALPPEASALAAMAGAIMLDARAPGTLGGSGVSFNWQAMAPALSAMRASARVIVAGGLNPANVGEAIRVLDPDVVDVSSGVEVAPGIKDPQRMTAFAQAVRA